MFFRTFFSVCLLLASAFVMAEPTNNDETKVLPYTLPALLVDSKGSPVDTVTTWESKRRPELIRLFAEEAYGVTPVPAGRPTFHVDAEIVAMDGAAIRKDVTITFAPPADKIGLRMSMYVPANAPGPSPVFVGVHVFDTHAEYPRVAQPLSSQGAQVPAEVLEGLPGEKTASAIIAAGFGFATLNIDEFALDDKVRFAEGVIGAYRAPDATGRAANEWGTLGAWAFGLSRALDYFEQDKSVDATRVIAIGHSRMGKTALWAAAQDTRFAMAISNDSGCMGAALSRRNFGETVSIMTKAFPHWFCPNFQQFAGRESAMSIDQHMLIALIAPRPVYIASAEEDDWADQRGEWLAGKEAEPAYALYGKTGYGIGEMPALNKPVGDSIGYHIRSGKHDMTDYDWMQYLAFAKRHLRR